VRVRPLFSTLVHVLALLTCLEVALEIPIPGNAIARRPQVHLRSVRKIVGQAQRDLGQHERQLPVRIGHRSGRLDNDDGRIVRVSDEGRDREPQDYDPDEECGAQAHARGVREDVLRLCVAKDVFDTNPLRR
jgi:hypothetical protein